MIWWIGAVFSLAAGVLIAGGLAVLMVTLLVNQVERLIDIGNLRGRRWSQNTLRSSAWWFSEDPVTMQLLMDLTQLTEWDARDKWRRARAGKETR